VRDYHIHTSLCKHASGTVDAYVRQAINAGLDEIAFTDHIPLPENLDLAHRMAMHEMETYQNMILKARASYPEITIRFGIEADYIEGLEGYLEEFLRSFDLDLVIMSVHFVRSWPHGNWVFDYDFPDKTKTTVFREYIDAVISGISTGLFDILGHADIIKRPGESVLEVCADGVEALLDALSASGMAIEINTSGFRKAVAETYPALPWLPLIIRKNIPITIGSDAHVPEQVALRFGEVTGALKQAGITTLAGYRQRVRSAYTL
jgi:histidinol-phosphatase (PHP family)